MFVQQNTIQEIKNYFRIELPNYSTSELNLILKSLTCNIMNISNSDYIIGDNLRLSESDLLQFNTALKRLKNGAPFQYVLGDVEFFGLTLKVDSRALIPRPETEELVEWVVETMQQQDAKLIMDLCAGSGCISLAVKSVLRSPRVIAAELSEGAVNLIKENKSLTQIDIDVAHVDVLDPGVFAMYREESFDCWVSNPPYIPMNEKNLMERNVLDYEPEMALFVEDNDPVLFYRSIAEKAVVYLLPGGFLFFEINENYSEEVLAVLERLEFVNIELRKDLQGKPRMIRAQKRNFTE